MLRRPAFASMPQCRQAQSLEGDGSHDMSTFAVLCAGVRESWIEKGEADDSQCRPIHQKEEDVGSAVSFLSPLAYVL